MTSLSFSDFLIILVAFSGVISSIFPNYFSIHKNGKITRGGWIYLLFCSIGLFIALASIISKADDDNEKYQTSLDTSDTTLNRLSRSLEHTNKLLALNDSSISALKKVQEESNNIQRQSDSIKKATNSLNEQLKKEIETQKEINKTTLKSLDIIDFRNQYDFFKDTLSFKFNCFRLMSINVSCKISPDRPNIVSYLNYLKEQKKEVLSKANFKIDNVSAFLYKGGSGFEDGLVLMGRLDSLDFAIRKEKEKLIEIDNKLRDCFLSFFYQTLDILIKEKANSILLTNPEAMQLWDSYYVKIQKEVSDINYLDYDFTQLQFEKIRNAHMDFGESLQRHFERIFLIKK